MMEDSEPLLERRKVPLEKKSVDSDEDDVEEIEAEPRPKNV